MQHIASTEELQALIVGLPFAIVTAHVMLDNVIAGYRYLTARK